MDTRNVSLDLMEFCRAKRTAKVRQFAKANYKNFIEINFEQMSLARLAFDGNS